MPPRGRPSRIKLVISEPPRLLPPSPLDFLPRAHVGRITGTLLDNSTTPSALAAKAAPSRGAGPLTSSKQDMQEHVARLPTQLPLKHPTDPSESAD